jgi:hypothetical protein
MIRSSLHYGFFNNNCNDVMHSLQDTYLMSSTTSGPNISMKGRGNYMYDENIRRSIIIFNVRCLSTHTWITDQDRYLVSKDIR